MDTQSLIDAVRTAVTDGIRADPWLSFMIVLVASAIGSCLGSYLRRKGENLATKEDIAEITKRVEEVKSQYAEKIENLSHQNRQIIEQGSRRHQLRMAALEKRLEVHQEAFALWTEMLSSAKDPKKNGNVVLRCQDWWYEHCLYLDPESRIAFKQAYFAASSHQDFTYTSADSKDRNENWNTIMRLGEILARGVELPPIGDWEVRQIEDDN